MLLGFLTVVVMLGVAWAYFRLGLMTAFMMCVNVFASGLLTFNFWEPLADTLDPMFTGTFLKGYEDALCMVVLFCLILGLLRLLTNYLCSAYIQFPAAVQVGGCIFFGMTTGYLVSGFLLTVFQTLPWHQNFMFFEYKYEPDAPSAVVRRVLPPDRIWLALMRRGGAFAFANTKEEERNVLNPDSFSDRFTREHLTFDKYGTFPLRYARYRRVSTNGQPIPYQGECDAEVHKRR